MLHSDGSRSSPGTVWTRNIVVPYMSMRSPIPCAPTLSASAQASMVPVVTGMPVGSPVRCAASAVTVPAASPDQRSPGSSMPGAIRSVHGVYQSRARVS